MAQQPYNRAPITEAVIEVRFESPVDPTKVEQTSADFYLDYPLENGLRNVNVHFEVPADMDDPLAPTVNRQEVGYRRSTQDLSEIILLWPASFVISQLAPYPGWDVFFRRFSRDWGIWKKAMGYRKIVRVGVRFINRIDMLLNDSTINHSNFVNIYPHLPEHFGPVSAYGIQAQLAINDIDCILTLNSGSVPSPLLKHASIALDIDIAKEVNTPQRDEDLFSLLNVIRTKKNEIFECCVTDLAREIFQR